MPGYISLSGYSDPPRIPHLSLEVNRGELVVLVGGPGSGKSNLVSSLAGIRKPVRGKLRILGCRPEDSGARARSVFLFQEQNFAPDRSVWSQLLRRLPLWGGDLGSSEVSLEKWCRERELLDVSSRNPEKIDPVSLNLLSLAPLHLARPAVAVLDEPLSNLSPEWTGSIAESLARLAEDTAVLVLTRRDGPFTGLTDRIEGLR